MPMINGKLVTLRRRPSPLHTYMIFELLGELIEDESLEEFMNTPRNDLIMYHMTLGRHIRNTYIYGKHNPCKFDKSGDFMDEYREEHPDDISFEMIESLHDHLSSLRSNGIDLYECHRNQVEKQEGETE